MKKCYESIQLMKKYNIRFYGQDGSVYTTNKIRQDMIGNLYYEV